MALGLSEKLGVLQKSPHDVTPSAMDGGLSFSTEQKWVPSRYNVRAVAEDGRLILWNTLSGKMTTFKAKDREKIIRVLKRRGVQGELNGIMSYLADRGYFVREGVNEFRQFQMLFGEQHYRRDALELIVMSSEDCNLRCRYCYEDFARGTMIPEVREGIKNLVRKRIKKLNRLHIAWFGGEPLYGWEAVEDLAPFFVEIADEYDVPFGANMTTNGYLLTPDVVDKLFAWRILRFQITLDGLPDHHNQSRPARDGSPTFERIFENLKSLARRDEEFSVLLRANFDQTNHDGLPEFVQMLADELENDPRFQLALKAVGQWGGDNDDNLEVCGAEDIARVQADMTALARSKGIETGSLRDVAKPGSQVCYAARPYNFLIGATGKVMKCTIVLDKDDYNVVGRITQEGELELDGDRLALWTEPAYEQDSQCRKCVVLPSCQGIHCPLVRIKQDTQPCISTRSNPKGELLDAMSAPRVGKVGRKVSVGNQITAAAPVAG